MKLSNERELAVLTYLMEKGSRPISDIRSELEISEDEDFQFEETLHDLIIEGSVTLISSESVEINPEIPKWEITELGKIHMKDLALDKYEEDNRMSYIIRAIIIVIAILAFMMIFPRMFHHF
jgi:hypothetical protein